MGCTIKNAELHHVADIEQLEKLCFSVPWTREQIISQLPDDMHVFIVAEEDNGAVIGYVGLMCVLDEGYISNVAVSPAHRRQGIGDALIERLTALAEEKRLSFMTLEVREGNIPARALYKKHGFTDVGLRKNYYTLPTENAVLMTKFLK